MAGTGRYLDSLKTLVRLRRQLNSNWVANSYFTSCQDDPHDTGLADYVAFLVTVKNCRHQAGLVVVQLPARIPEASHAYYRDSTDV